MSDDSTATKAVETVFAAMGEMGKPKEATTINPDSPEGKAIGSVFAAMGEMGKPKE